MPILTPYGRREWSLVTVAFALLAAGIASCAWRWSPWLLTALLPPTAVWVWAIAFFRDPERHAPAGEGLFVSPADGHVTDITQIGADSPLGRPGVQVGVFMSIFDVHVNRAPCDGRIDRTEHKDGAYIDVRLEEGWRRNEATTIWMTYEPAGRALPVVFRQVAGLLARRIVTDLRPGQTVRTSQRIGMIKFGSRVELMVPAELRPQVQVRVGEKVLAGKTVLIAAS